MLVEVFRLRLPSLDPNKYIAQLEHEHPGLRVVHKAEDAFSKCLDVAVRIVTFGAQRGYSSAYVTTIGRTIYLPSSWAARDPRNQYCTLRHEAVHLRQFERYGLVLTAFLYLLPILPLGLAWGRARLEWEAYAETFRATAEVFGEAAARDPALRDRVVKQFVSGAYGWMWPFRSQVETWIDEVLENL